MWELLSYSKNITACCGIRRSNAILITAQPRPVPVTYLLTPCSRVLLEKLTGLQLVKKFPTYYGTRRFVIAFTIVRHLSLSWASSIQSVPPHHTSWIPILILSSRLRLGLPSGLFPSGFPTKILIHLSSHPYVLHVPPISFSILSPEQLLWFLL